jgi:hypothetical protein
MPRFLFLKPYNQNCAIASFVERVKEVAANSPELGIIYKPYLFYMNFHILQDFLVSNRAISFFICIYYSRDARKVKKFSVDNNQTQERLVVGKTSEKNVFIARFQMGEIKKMADTIRKIMNFKYRYLTIDV